MTHQPSSAQAGPQASDGEFEWPIRFREHFFSAACYSTYGCRVVYGGRLRVDDPKDKLAIASETVPGYPNVLDASEGLIRNFPPPAEVQWRSKDGTPLSAKVDIGEIFKDGLVRHRLRRDEISPRGPGPGQLPGIILEVNDRTINVYMRAHVSTRELQKPGNRYSDFRDDLIKVHSQTY